MSESPSRILTIPPEQQTPQQAAILDAVLRARAFVPAPFLIWLHRPPLAEAMESLGTYLATGSSLSKREIEIAVVITARRLASPYVFDAHLRGAAAAGHPPDVVDALRDGTPPAFANDRERAIAAIAERAGDAGEFPDDVFDIAVAALGRDGLADLLALIGYYTAVAYAMKIHRVPVASRRE